MHLGLCVLQSTPDCWYEEGMHMPVNLKGRSLLTLKDFTPEEITHLLCLRRT